MSLKLKLITALIIANTFSYAQTTSKLPLVKGDTLIRGIKYLSASGNHYLLFQNDGLLVVKNMRDSTIWSNRSSLREPNLVARYELDPRSGYLSAYNSSNPRIWLWSLVEGKLYEEYTSQLHINNAGVLRLVGGGSRILWSSNGILTTSEFIIDPGWSKFRKIKNPDIVIMGTDRVTDKAMDLVVETYSEIIKFLDINPIITKQKKFNINDLNGYTVYVTNGGDWSELEKLKPIGTMWPNSGPMKDRGAYILGGTNNKYLWIDEQMMCKRGVESRNTPAMVDAIGSRDDDIRITDQIIHEIGHAIDMVFELNEGLRNIVFPEVRDSSWFDHHLPIQMTYYFGGHIDKGDTDSAKEERRPKMWMFFNTTGTTCGCNSYNMKDTIFTGDSLVGGEVLISRNRKFIARLSTLGELTVHTYNQGASDTLIWSSTNANNMNLNPMPRPDGSLWGNKLYMRGDAGFEVVRDRRDRKQRVQFVSWFPKVTDSLAAKAILRTSSKLFLNNEGILMLSFGRPREGGTFMVSRPRARRR